MQGKERSSKHSDAKNAVNSPTIFGTYRDWLRSSVFMTTPSRAKRPCPRRHRRRRLFRRLSRCLSLLLAQFAADQQAADSPPPRSPSPARDASPAIEEPPASPIVHWSQNRMELHGRVRAAERATPRAREGRQLAPRHPGGVRVRRAIVLTNAARRTAQGSIRLGLGLGLRPSAPSPPAIAAGYAHQIRGASCAQGLRRPAPAVLL